MPDVTFIPFSKIDLLMEDEIEKSGFWPSSQNEIFDIERFLEKHLKSGLDKDANLPDDVMGEVAFRRGKKTCVSINAGLTREMENAQAAWQIGRWRMTVAHECAHVILHGPLYLAQGAQDGFWGEPLSQIHRCYKKQDKRFVTDDFAAEMRDFEARYGWNSGCLINEPQARQRMEFQANRGGAALLMPANRTLCAASELFNDLRQNAPQLSQEARIERVVEQLAKKFLVSREAARIRCDDLEATKHADQLSLF